MAVVTASQRTLRLIISIIAHNGMQIVDINMIPRPLQIN